MHKINDGSLYIDDLKFSDIDLSSLRSIIGYVPQDNFLFDTSIKNNLLWANPNADEDDIWVACKQANADTFIKSLPQKLDTNVGTAGSRISGGQRQRISIARALIKKPKIVILDEATSSLDPESENLIHETIKKISKNITVILIAHNPETIKLSDYYYLIENGKIAEHNLTAESIKLDKSKLNQFINTHQ